MYTKDEVFTALSMDRKEYLLSKLGLDYNCRVYQIEQRIIKNNKDITDDTYKKLLIIDVDKRMATIVFIVEDASKLDLDMMQFVVNQLRNSREQLNVDRVDDKSIKNIHFIMNKASSILILDINRWTVDYDDFILGANYNIEKSDLKVLRDDDDVYIIHYCNVV